jgi:hypothetical protein
LFQTDRVGEFSAVTFEFSKLVSHFSQQVPQRISDRVELALHGLVAARMGVLQKRDEHEGVTARRVEQSRSMAILAISMWLAEMVASTADVIREFRYGCDDSKARGRWTIAIPA